MSQRMAFRVLSVAFTVVVLVLASSSALGFAQAQAQGTQRMQDQRDSTIWLEAGHPPVQQARFKSVKVVGGAKFTESRGVALHFAVLSLHDKPLWLKVEFKTPNNETKCEQYRQLAPSGQAFFVCPAPDLEPHSIYPIEVTLFTSKQLDDVLEKGTSAYRFTKDDVAALHALAETMARDRD